MDSTDRLQVKFAMISAATIVRTAKELKTDGWIVDHAAKAIMELAPLVEGYLPDHLEIVNGELVVVE
jgi:hypothetical protein